MLSEKRTGVEAADWEFLFRGAPLDANPGSGIKKKYEDGYAIRCGIVHPKSREARLRSTDPKDPLVLDFRFLSNNDDLISLREGLKVAREVANQDAIAPYRGRELTPGAEVQTDADLDEFIRNTLLTIEHPACTCPMGTGPDCVLDPDMKVRGIDQLRVVDGSAMPDLTSAHINSTILMMAEKASDMILGREGPAGRKRELRVIWPL